MPISIGNSEKDNLIDTSKDTWQIQIPKPFDIQHEPTEYIISPEHEPIKIQIHEYMNISRNNFVYSFYKYNSDLNTIYQKPIDIGYVDKSKYQRILNDAIEISKFISENNGISNTLIDKIEDYANIYINNRYLNDSQDSPNPYDTGFDYMYDLYNIQTFQKILNINIFPLRNEIVNNPNIIITKIYYRSRNVNPDIDKENDVDEAIQKDNSKCEKVETINYQIFNTELFVNNNKNVLMDLKNNYVFDDNLYDYVKFINDDTPVSTDNIEKNIKFSFFDNKTLNNEIIKKTNANIIGNNETLLINENKNIYFALTMLLMSNIYGKLYDLFTDQKNKYLKDEFFLNNIFDDYYNNIIETLTFTTIPIPTEKDTLITETDQLKKDIRICITDKFEDFKYTNFYTDQFSDKDVLDIINLLFNDIFKIKFNSTEKVIDVKKLKGLTYSEFNNFVIKDYEKIYAEKDSDDGISFGRFFLNNIYNIFNMKSYNVIAQLAYYKYFYRVIFYNTIATKYLNNYDADFNVDKHLDEFNNLLNNINTDIQKENNKNNDIVEISNKKNEYLESSRTYNNVKQQLINSNEVINSNIEDYNSRLEYDNNLKIFSKILYVVLLVILILFLINIIYIPEYRVKIVNNGFIIFITIILIIYVNYYYQKNSDKYEHFDNIPYECFITFNDKGNIKKIIFNNFTSLSDNLKNTIKTIFNAELYDLTYDTNNSTFTLKDEKIGINLNKQNTKDITDLGYKIKYTNNKNCSNLNSADPSSTISIDNKYRELATFMSKYLDYINNYLNVVSYNLSNTFNKNILKKSTEGVDYSIKKTKDKLQNTTVIKNNLLSNRNNIKFTTLHNYNYNMFFCLSLLILLIIYTLYTVFYPYYLYPILFIGIILYIILLFVYIFHVKRIVHVDTDKRYWARQIF